MALNLVDETPCVLLVVRVVVHVRVCEHAQDINVA